MRRALLLALSLLAIQQCKRPIFSLQGPATPPTGNKLPMSGSAERSLTKGADNVWTLNFKAPMLIASLNEESTLKLEKDQPVPLSYQLNGGLGKAKNIDLNFNWKDMTVTGTDNSDGR